MIILKAAIYSRKSKLTFKGESIENQIQLCREYARNNLNITDYIVYEDEGFSGGNTDRPEFQKLLKDAKEKKFDVLICYRLDRISRNVSDFSNTIELLNKYNIAFVSIREQFDTSTPMGRAMMMIASVFAQLERETIAERIKDNMLELAKTGRWLGGVIPFGFTVNKVKENGKEVAYLEINQNEDIKFLYEKYLEFGSLFKLTKHLLINDVTGRQWTQSRLSLILKNPVYCQASEEAFNYFIAQGITVIGTPDNSKGFMPYNRRGKGKEEWILAVSNHDAVIDSSTWIMAQKVLSKNSKQRSPVNSTATLLNGLLRCGICGSKMGELYGALDRKGNRKMYYKCTHKIFTAGTKCNNPNAKAAQIDTAVIKYLKDISLNPAALNERVAAMNEVAATKTVDKDIDKIKKAITKNEQAIQNLVKQLSLLSAEASTYIISEIERMTKENTELKGKLLLLENEKTYSDTKKLNVDMFLNSLKNFPDAFDKAESMEDKKILLCSVVKEIYWNGDTNDISIKLLGVEE